MFLTCFLHLSCANYSKTVHGFGLAQAMNVNANSSILAWRFWNVSEYYHWLLSPACIQDIFNGSNRAVWGLVNMIWQNLKRIQRWCCCTSYKLLKEKLNLDRAMSTDDQTLLTSKGFTKSNRSHKCSTNRFDEWQATYLFLCSTED